MKQETENAIKVLLYLHDEGKIDSEQFITLIKALDMSYPTFTYSGATTGSSLWYNNTEGTPKTSHTTITTSNGNTHE